MTALSTTATNALDAGEKRQLKLAKKKAEWKLRWDKLRREYMAQLEVERLQKLVAITEQRLGRGRQQTIPEEIIERILQLHASGEPLQTSCDAYDVDRWHFCRRCNERDDLRAGLAAAREQNAHSKIDGSWALARTEPDVERARLLVDLAKWEVAKVLPHLYGDRLKVDMPDGVAFTLNIGQVVERKEEKLIE